MQQQVGNILPPIEVTNKEILAVRMKKPGLINVPDTQLRAMMISDKNTITWQQQQQEQRQQSDRNLLQPAAANNIIGTQGVFPITNLEAIITLIEYGPNAPITTRHTNHISSRAR